MSSYQGIIFTVVGLFSTTVLFSICMSCYKCFMKRRRKALSNRTITEGEQRVAGHPDLPNGIPSSSTEQPESSQHVAHSKETSKYFKITSVPHKKTVSRPVPVITGKRYPKTTTSPMHKGVTSASEHQALATSSNFLGTEQSLKRHSLYYSMESMASLASAIEDNP